MLVDLYERWPEMSAEFAKKVPTQSTFGAFSRAATRLNSRSAKIGVLSNNGLRENFEPLREPFEGRIRWPDA